MNKNFYYNLLINYKLDNNFKYNTIINCFLKTMSTRKLSIEHKYFLVGFPEDLTWNCIKRDDPRIRNINIDKATLEVKLGSNWSKGIIHSSDG